MKRHLFCLLGVLVLCTQVMADDDEEKKGPAASDLLSAGLVKAKEEGKSVFLVFGSPGCGWCVKLEKYHRDPEVAQVLGKHLVHVKVDTVKNPGGEELYKKYGKDRGVPAFTLLDAEAKVLGDSGDGADNIGFPYEPKEIEHYLKVLKKGCPRITEGELELLTNKLKAFNPKKDK